MIIIRGEDGAIRLINSSASIHRRETEDGQVMIYLSLHLPGEDMIHPLVTVKDHSAADFIEDRIMDAFGNGATVLEVHVSGVDTWEKE